MTQLIRLRWIRSFYQFPQELEPNAEETRVDRGARHGGRKRIRFRSPHSAALPVAGVSSVLSSRKTRAGAGLSRLS